MADHGRRLDAITSHSRKRFECHVCRRRILNGDRIVGFFNRNKAPPQHFDHCCADGCADKYVSPPLEKKSVGKKVAAAVSSALVSVSGMISGSAAASSPTRQQIFEEKAMQVGASKEQALIALEQHAGDDNAALMALSSAWLNAANSELDATSPGRPAPLAACSDCDDDAASSSSEQLPPEVAKMDAFSAAAARLTGLDVFNTFIKPMLPKPQGDGSFKDGDAVLLDSLMETPITLSLPRAERLADLIKPESGWDDKSLRRVRAFFALAAAGTQFIIYLPTILFRQELARQDCNDDMLVELLHRLAAAAEVVPPVLQLPADSKTNKALLAALKSRPQL